MSVLQIILVIVDLIVCLLLVGAILLQRNNGNGMGAAFGGSGEAIFGAQMGNVLTKTTVVLGTLFLAITLALSYTMSHRAVRRVNRATQPAPAAPVAAEPIAADAGADALEIPAEEPVAAPDAPAASEVPAEAPVTEAPATEAPAAPAETPVPAAEPAPAPAE